MSIAAVWPPRTSLTRWLRIATYRSFSSMRRNVPCIQMFARSKMSSYTPWPSEHSEWKWQLTKPGRTKCPGPPSTSSNVPLSNCERGPLSTTLPSSTTSAPSGMKASSPRWTTGSPMTSVRIRPPSVRLHGDGFGVVLVTVLATALLAERVEQPGFELCERRGGDQLERARPWQRHVEHDPHAGRPSGHHVDP